MMSVCGPGPRVVAVALPDTTLVPADAAFPVLLADSVTRVGGQAFRVLRSSVDLERDTMIAVQWHPTPDSPPYRSRTPARIHPVGDTVLLRPALRPSPDDEGRPVGDIRRSYRAARGREETPGGRMHPDEAFDFCDLSVDVDRVSGGDVAGISAPLEWARASDGAWRKAPAAGHLVDWVWQVERARIGRVPVEVAGTWRADVTLPSGERTAFFFRTRSRADGIWRGPPREPFPALDAGPPWAYRARGVDLRIWTARELDALPGPGREDAPCPTPWAFPERSDLPCALFVDGWSVGLAAEGDRGWVGYMDPLPLSRAVPDIAEAMGPDAEFGPWFRARWEADPQFPRPGRIERTDEGLRYRQELATPAGPVVLDAVRISDVVVPEEGRGQGER